MTLKPYEIIIAGYSESRSVAQVLQDKLRCPAMGIHKENGCSMHHEWREKRNATFLAECRNRLAIVSVSCANKTKLVWAWESYANIDPRLERLVNATTGWRHVLVYSVGAHYFSQFSGFNESMLYAETVERPQEWLNHYYADMTRLMQWFQHWRNSYGCVIWKTNNIFQPRDGNENQSVHPNRVNGIHAMLNKWSMAMMKAYGIPVLDVQPHTIWESTVKPLSDYYHGYDFAWQADKLLRAIAVHC